MSTISRRAAAAALALVFGGANAAFAAEPVELLNVSYDISRELFTEINPAFVKQWKAKTGQDVVVRQSHGGSSKQARSVAEGLQADVVTFNQVTDIEFLRKTGGLVAEDWRTRFPNSASPYYSLPLFLVRKGNPKGIRDWSDLAKPGVQVIVPNPKTSGNGRYSYLGAYAFALGQSKGDDAKAQEFVGKVLANVPVFDTGGRGATTTFVEREIGDVLLTFESEVKSIREEYAKSGVEVIVPSVSVRADFPVAVVDKFAQRKGTADVAKAYLDFLYTDAGQDILAKNYNRVRSEAVAKRYAAQFPNVRLVSIEETFGGWDKVTSQHFGDGGVLDKLIAKNNSR